MHQHKTITQILLALTILNSVLAAPIVMVREQEIPRADVAVAVRVPAEDTVAMLVKRPYTPPGTPQSASTEETVAMLVKELGGSQPSGSQSSGLAVGSPEPHPPAPAGAVAGTPAPQSVAVGSPEPHPPAPAGAAAGTPAPQSVAAAKPSVPSTSKSAWREKIMTPGKIKSIGLVGAAGLLTAGYLTLLLPGILRNDDQKNKS